MAQVQTKSIDQQNAINALVNLVKSDLNEEEFYEQFLHSLPVPSGTTQAIAWRFDANGQSLKRLAGWALASVSQDLPINKEDQGRLIGAVINTGEPELYDLAELSTDPGTSMVAILPVHSSVGVVAVIETFFSTQVPLQAANAFLAQADFLCGVAASFHSPKEENGKPNFVQVAGQIHKSLNVLETAYAIANESRRVTECDRVSVLVRKGDKYQVKSVSGQETVNKRANAVKSVQALVARAAAVNEPFWYPDDAMSVPPEIEAALEYHLDTSLCKTIGIVPLFASAKTDDPTEEQLPATHTREPIGALVVEHFTDIGEDQDRLIQQISVISEQAGIALGNAKAHEGVFLLPFWRWIGGFRKFFEGNRRNKTLAAIAAATVLLTALCIIPSPFRISSEGTLQPKTRSNVFAPMDGTVDELFVDQNQDVVLDQELLRLKSESLELAIRKLEGERLTVQASIDTLRAKRLSRRRDQDPMELEVATAELADLTSQLKSVQKQLDLRHAMREQLVVRSPIAGRVVSWNLKENLADRPVTRGQLLLEIVAPEEDWELELELPDRRIGHVLRAHAASSAPLPVTFILASAPGTRLHGTLAEFEQRTNATTESGQFVRLNVDIDRADVEFQQPGTKVQAKVLCGHRSTLYVWLHDIVEFFQSRVLFRVW